MDSCVAGVAGVVIASIILCCRALSMWRELRRVNMDVLDWTCPLFKQARQNGTLHAGLIVANEAVEIEEIALAPWIAMNCTELDGEVTADEGVIVELSGNALPLVCLVARGLTLSQCVPCFSFRCEDSAYCDPCFRFVSEVMWRARSCMTKFSLDFQCACTLRRIDSCRALMKIFLSPWSFVDTVILKCL